MTIDFVLVNYHCTDDVARILGEIERTVPMSHTITVIDNSVDNRGFAKAANLGASVGSGDIICFLNPDIHLVPGWAGETLASFSADPELVIAGPRLDDGFPWPRDLSRSGISNWVCGACFLVRRSFFDSVAGFDERFFFTYEETDLIRRAESTGLRVRSQHVANPVIKHIRHHTPFHDDQLQKGRAIYIQKWGN